MDAARDAASESLALHRHLNSPWGISVSLVILGMLQVDEVRTVEMVEESRDVARNEGDRWLVGFAVAALARIALETNDDQRATELAEEAAALYRALGSRRNLPEVLLILVQTSLRAGEVDRAAAFAQEMMASVRDTGDVYALMLTHWCLGLVAEARGDAPGALALQVAGLGMAAEKAIPFCEGLIATAALLVPRGHAEAAAHLLGAAEVRWEMLAATPEQVGMGAVVAAVEETCRAAMGDDAYSAAVAVGRSLPLSAVYLEARALDISAQESENARAGLLDGDRESERASTAESPVPSRLRLSPREVDVLRLVSAGRRDREIAEELFLSRRTVTSHMTSILTKLDVPSRAAAVALAAREGLI